MPHLFLFTAPRAISARAGSLALAGGGEVVGPAISTLGKPFALDAEAWRRLPLIVSESQHRREPAAAQAAMAATFTDRALLDAWRGFVSDADKWGLGVRDGLRVLADDVASYAETIAPDLYGRLAALLKPLRQRAPSLEEAQACVALLEALAAAADERSERAAELDAYVGPFVGAVNRFVDLFAVYDRNPPVRVVLPRIPGLCLAYGDDGQARASDMKQADKRQYWVLEPSGEAYVLISAAEPGKVLVVDQDEDLMAMTRPAPPFTFADRGPRPRVEFWDKAPINAARFRLSAEQHLQNVSYQTLTLECGGEGGWAAGTPVESLLKSEASNQRWSFDPPLRSRQELVFYDLIAPVGDLALNIVDVHGLRGDWASVADDLRSGAREILGCVETGAPFVPAVRVEQTLECWRKLAIEARDAAAGLYD